MYDTRPLIAAFVAALLFSCGSQALRSVGGELSVPESVAFEPTFVGFTSEVTVELRNESRATRSIALSAEAPFEVATQTMELGAGSSGSFNLRFRPAAEGLHDGTLHVRFEGRDVEVPLQASALAVPSCESSECIERHFEPGRGCVDVEKPEGASCGAGDRCLVNATCHRGECLGNTAVCDDGNACTADSCAPQTGCAHQAIECQPSTDPCQASACDPVLGCRTVPVVDGTSCGANDCQTAHVCIAGACVQRASPEGSVCAPATTCRAERRCVAGSCGAPNSNTPPLAWSYTPPMGGAIVTHAVAGDGALFFLEASTRTVSLVVKAFEKTGASRFEVDLTAEPGLGQALMIDDATGRLFVAVRTYNVPTPKTVVEAFDLHTGALIWEHDVSADVPLTDGSEKAVDVQRLMLLDAGAVGVLAVEGKSIHQSYVLALDGANGAVRFQVHRSGHAQAGVTKSGLLFVSHAACWAQQSYLTTFDASGTELSTVAKNAWLSGFAMDSAVLWTGTQFELAGPSAGPNAALPLPMGHSFVVGSPGWSPTETVYVTRSAQGFHLTRPQGSTVQWSTLVSQDLSKNVSLQRLDLGRTAAFVNGPTVQELVIVSAAGDELDRCVMPGSTALQVIAGVTVARSNQGIKVFSTPTLDVAKTGWVGSAGGPQGTYRPR